MKKLIYSLIVVVLFSFQCCSIEKRNNRLVKRSSRLVTKLKEKNKDVKSQDDSVNNKTSSFLEIYEQDANGDSISLTEKIRVVDPNSELYFKLNNNEISSLFINDNRENKELTLKLKKYQELLTTEQVAMKTIAQGLINYQKGEDWDFTSLAPIVSAVYYDVELKNIYSGYIDADETNIYSTYLALFKTLRDYSEIIEKKFVQEAKENGIYIQIGAFLRTKQGQNNIHIPGFDSYEPSAPYSVDRLQLVLTDEQKEYIEKIGEFSTAANQQGITEAMKVAIRNKIKVTLDTIDTELTNIELELKSAISELRDRSSILKSEFEASISRINNYKYLIIEFREKYQSEVLGNSSNALLAVNADISKILNDGKDLKQFLIQRKDVIQSLINTMHFETNSKILAVKDKMLDIAIVIEKKVGQLKSKVGDEIDLIRGHQGLASEVFNFTDKVHKLGLGTIPKRGTISLETSGKRDIGDQIVIRLLAGRPNEAPKELVLNKYYLYFCTPYVRTAPSFLFTDPNPFFNKDEGKSLFHYAPSYSILLKGFWRNKENARKSLAYHNFYSPGIGLNIATLDFDGNGAPEVGMGGVFSIFQDFLQIGLGANMFSGRGYYFVGLKLPVGSFSVR